MDTIQAPPKRKKLPVSPAKAILAGVTLFATLLDIPISDMAITTIRSCATSVSEFIAGGRSRLAQLCHKG